ncbi:3-hydroxyacyl-CoA dehydrogenase NAD-binding domain-containing protein [Novosphingobium sp. FSW06-99]|uniref:3-hydroxyacyl-CoA dehydrogenase NAD-binding domain-containing protein n=1 Tax=Novosphingobium sp. FSW06-99 TaxID=1739113 RepID=UPI00076D8E77|nr:3-hydroxyacyl-CoA dehydrogenase NAD-binding domain-containing protein [Novosphingobium sp. FSW06-99]KUR79792.1 hydroxylacyl-CoA dehydrogenase [Novosphingobium sp. FSW06-99]
MTGVTSNNTPAGKTVAIIGGGVIGASWAALFLVNGLKVIISDPDPDIAAKAGATIDAALHSLVALGYAAQEYGTRLSFEQDNRLAVAAADFVQECAPERVEFKQALWQAIEAAAPAHALLLSSSSSIPASVQAAKMADPGRLVIGHPFNPPHLMPLLEVVPSPQTSDTVTARARAFYRDIGKVALVLRKEISGFVANRLQAAIFQESVYLVAQGVVTLDELDDVVTSSLGIRWATSGPFLSFHLGGGPGGLTHFIDHLGPPLEQSWATLGKAAFDAPTKALLAEQVARSYGTEAFSALAETRDAKEIAVINGLGGVTSQS